MMTMSKEEQSIKLVNPERSKIKMGTGIGLILISFILLLLSFSFSEYTPPIEIIIKFASYLFLGFGSLLIVLGGGGQTYKSQWIKKRESL